MRFDAESTGAHRIEGADKAHAGLDVTDPEPLPDGHPLFSAPNVTITPHVAIRADVPRERMEAVEKENVRRYVAGDKMLSVVNPKLGY